MHAESLHCSIGDKVQGPRQVHGAALGKLRADIDWGADVSD